MKSLKPSIRQLSLCFALLCNASAEPPEISSDNYKLVWADEFEVDGKPDPKNWTYENGFVRNKELQWYQPDNANIKDGKLVIEAKRVKSKNPNFEEGSNSWRKYRYHIDYTSACLITKGLQSWKYGRFEIKARIKTKDGLWPAIWFLGEEGKWPYNGEIDLMEYYKGNLLANLCWGAKKPGEQSWASSHTSLKSFNDPQWDEKFHIWRMDWDEKSIKLYLDGKLLNSVDLSTTLNPATAKIRNPFQQKHYLLLNLAIGGHAGGDPTNTAFPTKYEIDYVRVYQQQQDPASK